MYQIEMVSFNVDIDSKNNLPPIHNSLAHNMSVESKRPKRLLQKKRRKINNEENMKRAERVFGVVMVEKKKA